MAFFNGYFDESGKFRDHTVISFAGFIAAPEQWGHLQDDWEYLLRRNGVKSFHLAEVLKFNRPLSLKRPSMGIQERTEVINEFVRAIKKHVEHGVAISVDVSGFKDLKSHQQEKLRDPHYVAFVLAMMELAEHIRPLDDEIALACDDEEQFSVECYKHYTRIRKDNAEMRRKFICISFADDDYFPQLQAADLYAGISRLEAKKEFLGEEHAFGGVVSEFKLHDPSDRMGSITGRFMDSKQLADFAASL